MADVAKYFIKAYEDKEFKDLATAPVDALSGVSGNDAKTLAPLGIKTVHDLATYKLVLTAQAVANLAGGPHAVAGAKDDDLASIGATDAEKDAFKTAFNIATISKLAANKYVRLAQAVVALAEFK